MCRFRVFAIFRKLQSWQTCKWHVSTRNVWNILSCVPQLLPKCGDCQLHSCTFLRRILRSCDGDEAKLSKDKILLRTCVSVHKPLLYATYTIPPNFEYRATFFAAQNEFKCIYSAPFPSNLQIQKKVPYFHARDLVVNRTCTLAAEIAR